MHIWRINSCKTDFYKQTSFTLKSDIALTKIFHRNSIVISVGEFLKYCISRIVLGMGIIYAVVNTHVEILHGKYVNM